MSLSYIRVLFSVTMVACLAGCIRASGGEMSVSYPIPISRALESRTINYRVPDRAGKLTPAQRDSIAPRIRALRADPADLALEVGDTLRLPDVVRIFALDSAGTVLGELPNYDFAFSGRGFRILADGRFVFSRAGRMRFTASLQTVLWRGRPADLPEATVSVTVYRGGS